MQNTKDRSLSHADHALGAGGAERLFGAFTAIIDAEARFTWAEHLNRVKRLARVLQENGSEKATGLAYLPVLASLRLIHAGYWNGSVPVPSTIGWHGNPLYSRRCPNFAALYRGAFLDLLKTENWLVGAQTQCVCIWGRSDHRITVVRRLISTATPVEGNSGEEDAILLTPVGLPGGQVRLTHRNVFRTASNHRP